MSTTTSQTEPVNQTGRPETGEDSDPLTVHVRALVGTEDNCVSIDTLRVAGAADKTAGQTGAGAICTGAQTTAGVNAAVETASDAGATQDETVNYAEVTRDETVSNAGATHKNACDRSTQETARDEATQKTAGDTGAAPDTDEDTVATRDIASDSGTIQIAGDTGATQETAGDTGATQETAGDTGATQETAGDTGATQETAGDVKVTQETEGDSGTTEEKAGDAGAAEEAVSGGGTTQETTGYDGATQETAGDAGATQDTRGSTEATQKSAGNPRATHKIAGDTRATQETAGDAGTVQETGDVDGAAQESVLISSSVISVPSGVSGASQERNRTQRNNRYRRMSQKSVDSRRQEPQHGRARSEGRPASVESEKYRRRARAALTPKGRQQLEAHVDGKEKNQGEGASPSQSKRLSSATKTLRNERHSPVAERRPVASSGRIELKTSRKPRQRNNVRFPERKTRDCAVGEEGSSHDPISKAPVGRHQRRTPEKAVKLGAEGQRVPNELSRQSHRPADKSGETSAQRRPGPIEKNLDQVEGNFQDQSSTRQPDSKKVSLQAAPSASKLAGRIISLSRLIKKERMKLAAAEQECQSIESYGEACSSKFQSLKRRLSKMEKRYTDTQVKLQQCMAQQTTASDARDARIEEETSLRGSPERDVVQLSSEQDLATQPDMQTPVSPAAPSVAAAQ